MRQSIRKPLIPAALMTFAMLAPALAQDEAPARKGRPLERAGRAIRDRVENELNRGENEDHEVLSRVKQHLRWDKKLAAAVLQVEVGDEGEATVRGSVPDQAAKDRAIDLIGNTHGVSRVVDELVVGKEVRVVENGKAVHVPKAATPVIVANDAKVTVKK